MELGASFDGLPQADATVSKDKIFITEKKYGKGEEKIIEEKAASQGINIPYEERKPLSFREHLNFLASGGKKSDNKTKIEFNEKAGGEDKMLEFKFGSKILTGIGVVAVVLGAGFFLKFAFENNLITETMRIVLGILLGVILLGVGELTRKNLP